MQKLIISCKARGSTTIYGTFILILTIVLMVCLPSYGEQQFISVQNELDKLEDMPVASREDLEKFTEAEKRRGLLALGPFSYSKVQKMRAKAATANKYEEWQEVIELYEKILTMDPQDWGAFLMLANSYNAVGNPDKALEYALKGLQKNRHNVLFAIVADSYGKKGDKYRALSWLEKALRGGFTMSRENFDRAFEQYQYDSQYNELLEKYKIVSGSAERD